MKTDRELTELAARAVGLELTWRQWGPNNGPVDLEVAYIPADNDHGRREWRPLDDDGDALRLAVAVKADISVSASHILVTAHRAPDVRVDVREKPGEHQFGPATRRAIVRAAAALA